MRTLTSPNGTEYGFDPGCFCLELLLTGGPGDLAHFEVLDRPGALDEWLPDSELAAIAPLDDLVVTAAETERVRALRDALWTIVRAVLAGDRPGAGEIAVLNGAAAEPPPRPAVDPGSGAARWVGPVTGAQVLGAAAREAVALLTSPRLDRVRECAAGDCRLVFLDTSRPGTRRWCSMRRCGNRRKVAEYRARGGA